MENFSALKNFNTSRDNLINQVVSLSGLSEEKVKNLYESFAIQHNNDFVKINESFSQLLNPTSTFDYEGFSNKILELSKKLTTNLTIDERNQITDQLFLAVQESCGINVDTPTLLEVICFVLLSKNPNFKQIASNIGYGMKFRSLNECVDFHSINITPFNTLEQNQSNVAKTVQLYESLKIILSRNNKKWGYNYHLDNAFNAIWDYLNNEIVELTNQSSIVTVNDTFHMDLIKMMVEHEQLNPMYRHVDSLRKLIPDIQTLVYDCMVLVHNYIDNDSYTIQFISRKAYIEYLEATKLLFANISSSYNSSKIVYRPTQIDSECCNNSESTYVRGSYGSEYSQIFEKLRIDTKILDLNIYPIRVSTASECLQIIKACETEFNLQIRKIINTYFTKAMNLVASTEKILIEKRKSNKFKNGY